MMRVATTTSVPNELYVFLIASHHWYHSSDCFQLFSDSLFIIETEVCLKTACMNFERVFIQKLGIVEIDQRVLIILLQEEKLPSEVVTLEVLLLLRLFDIYIVLVYDRAFFVVWALVRFLE